MGPTRRWVARATAVTVTVFALVWAAPSAQAAPPVDRGTSTETTTDTVEECGLTLVVSTTSHVRYTVRPAPRDPLGVATLRHELRTYLTVITNQANGKRVYESGISTFQELSATHVSGNVYTYVAQETGVPYVLTSAKGKVLMRDYGVVRWRATFDIVGGRHAYSNTGPSADDIILITGQHPSWTVDFCDVALPYLT